MQTQKRRSLQTGKKRMTSILRHVAKAFAKLCLSDLHNDDSRCRTAGCSLTSYPGQVILVAPSPSLFPVNRSFKNKTLRNSHWGEYHLQAEILTFELRVEHRSGFLSKEDLLGVLGEHTALLGRQDELAQESRPVAYVVILVVLGEVKDVLTQEVGLFVVGDAQLGREVQDL